MAAKPARPSKGATMSTGLVGRAKRVRIFIGTEGETLNVLNEVWYLLILHVHKFIRASGRAKTTTRSIRCPARFDLLIPNRSPAATAIILFSGAPTSLGVPSHTFLFSVR